MTGEIHCRLFPTKVRTHLPGQGAIGFGPRQWRVSKLVSREALLRLTCQAALAIATPSVSIFIPTAS